ncbi:EAL domain-containing response regulator [Paremcibacter congregatus]|uniref:EAL domain-containing response regulator n=1 Tax=Paremcibacter congregatus TaxID=2043170 RepID=UPI0030EBB841|tara:strand:- start:1714 stop:2889 length:1176 start_codon:yes stop_codon:yes gene_type:complete
MTPIIPNSRPKLLVVDDEVDVADFIAEVAEGVGYETMTVNEGQHFFEMVTRYQPTSIILDLNLPGYDGVELLRYLAEQKSSAAIYIASGADQRTIAAAQSLGKQYNLNIVESFSKPVMVEELEKILSLNTTPEERVSVSGIRKALVSREIRPFFQPKVDLNNADNKMIGVEALVRWITTSGQMIFPDEFLPVVAAEGLMPELTAAVVEQSFAAQKMWLDNGLDITVAINLDGCLLSDLRLPDKLADQAATHGISPHKVTLEITETAVMQDTAATMDVATRLRLKGFSLSIDDFGTGYSSLISLYNLPFNELKVDKSFVLDIEKNHEASVIIEILTSLGKKLDLKVCAEGIESRKALTLVKTCGCDTGQGFLFSKAVDAKTILAYAENGGLL